jgi:hypothetical protein
MGEAGGVMGKGREPKDEARIVRRAE